MEKLILLQFRFCFWQCDTLFTISVCCRFLLYYFDHLTVTAFIIGEVTELLKKLHHSTNSMCFTDVYMDWKGREEVEPFY